VKYIDIIKKGLGKWGLTMSYETGSNNSNASQPNAWPGGVGSTVGAGLFGNVKNLLLAAYGAEVLATVLSLIAWNDVFAVIGTIVGVALAYAAKQRLAGNPFETNAASAMGVGIFGCIQTVISLSGAVIPLVMYSVLAFYLFVVITGLVKTMNDQPLESRWYLFNGGMPQQTANENPVGLAPATAAARTVASDPAPNHHETEQLKQLGELHASGILTDEEYAAKKAELLKRM
jgi:hypothetical protein